MASNLFEALAEAFYKPQVNAVGINAQNQYVDANGQPRKLSR